jgi:fermentation-respiration switch protein FrsA (DUF1100 family)
MNLTSGIYNVTMVLDIPFIWKFRSGKRQFRHKGQMSFSIFSLRQRFLNDYNFLHCFTAKFLQESRFLANKSSTENAVILAHGYRGSNEQMPGITKFYYEQGFNILKPDARGHGESEGDYIGYGWHDRKDYQAWISFLTNEKGSENIYLHGFSMGGAAVLMTSGEALPEEVKGIINDSGYTSVKDELTHQLKHMYHLPAFPLVQVTSFITKIRAGFSFEEASSIEQVQKNTRPLFIIHGDEDELVPTEMAYRLADAATTVDKALWIVPGAGHTEAYTVAREEYEHRLKAFLLKATNGR